MAHQIPTVLHDCIDTKDKPLFNKCFIHLVNPCLGYNLGTALMSHPDLWFSCEFFDILSAYWWIVHKK